MSGRQRVERVILAGGSGLIGRALAVELVRAGVEVVVLTRSGHVPPLPAGARAVRWDGRSAAGWAAECEGAEAIVNLAGENVGDGRWTAARKRRLEASRVEPTRAIVEAVRAARVPPRSLLQGSAVGCYGDGGERPLDETSPRGEGFLPELSARWEEASAPVEALGVRRVLLRTGLVLSRDGGALAKMLTPFRLGLGGPLGGGRQWFPWIHLDDEIGAIRFLLERHDLAGVFNLVAPGAVRQGDFARALGRALGRPAVAPVPGAILRLALGDMAGVLLGGQLVIPARLAEHGYRFRYPDLDGALADLVGRP
jgi:uncharacterized protein (TIGR01777 family)